MRKKGKCVHFNGIGNECCKVGVNYKKLCGDVPGYGALIPCLGPNFGPQGAKREEKVPCEKFQEPTEAEIAEDKAAMQEATDMFLKVEPFILMMKNKFKDGKRFVSGSEKVKCPACETGELHVAISGYNGHTQGRGDIEIIGCSEWLRMEDVTGEFIALARNAFDVMMRRKTWIVRLMPSHADRDSWVVLWGLASGPGPFKEYQAWAYERNHDNPFTALVEADKWYRENVEKIKAATSPAAPGQSASAESPPAEPE